MPSKPELGVSQLGLVLRQIQIGIDRDLTQLLFY